MGGPNPELRYRLVLSDGETYTQAVLATQKNGLVGTGPGQINDKNTVVRVTDYLCNQIPGADGQTKEYVPGGARRARVALEARS